RYRDEADEPTLQPRGPARPSSPSGGQVGKPERTLLRPERKPVGGVEASGDRLPARRGIDRNHETLRPAPLGVSPYQPFPPPASLCAGRAHRASPLRPAGTPHPGPGPIASTTSGI